MSKLGFYLTLIFRPSFWVMNERYSASWDIELNHLMKQHSFKGCDSYTAQLDERLIWVANYPYGAFCPRYGMNNLPFRPSRYTIYVAREKWESDMFEKAPEGAKGREL